MPKLAQDAGIGSGLGKLGFSLCGAMGFGPSLAGIYVCLVMASGKHSSGTI